MLIQSQVIITSWELHLQELQIKEMENNSSENSKDDDTGFTLPPIGKN